MSRTVLALAILIAATSPAAGERDPAAKRHVDAGVAAYDAGDYETAIREFEAAHAVDPDPALLYAWAQSLRLGKRCPEALTLYRRYLETEPNETQVAAATHGIAECAEALASAAVPAPAPPPPEPPRQIDTPPPWYKDRIGGGLAIGGALSIGTGVAFLVLSSRSRDAATDAELRDDFVRHLDDATLRRRIGIAGLGIGTALIAGGIARYVTRRKAPTVDVAVTSSSIGLRARF